MVPWELSGVAVLMAALFVVCWALNGWNRSQFWPSFLRGVARRGCRTSRSHRSAGRRQPLSLRPLPPELRAYYAGACRSTEAAFSTAPHAAIQKLDRLAAEALRQCGYPVDTFEHNVARILPAAPQVVEDYRTAHSIALANDSGIASEPDLRLAVFHYHSLLETLLEDDGPEHMTSSQR
jgi:hypothetical protein